jgi:hypothetical protein
VRCINRETLAPLARAHSSISSTVPSEASRTNILRSPSCNILKRTPGANRVVRARSTSATSDHSNSILGPPKTRSNARPTTPGREERRLPPSSSRRSTENGQVLVDTVPPSSSQLAPLIQLLEPISSTRFRPCGSVSAYMVAATSCFGALPEALGPRTWPLVSKLRGRAGTTYQDVGLITPYGVSSAGPFPPRYHRADGRLSKCRPRVGRSGSLGSSARSARDGS